MGKKTKGALDKEISSYDVFDFIKNSIDSNAKNLTKPDRFNDKYFEDFITFNYKGEDRNIFYCVTEDVINDTRELRVHLLLGCHGYSIEIMKKIVSYFGGFILENDSLSDYYFYIEKNSNVDQVNENIKKRKKLAKELNVKDENEANKIASIILENKEIIKKYLI